MSYGFKIMVEGDYACFTRPEFKVERVSYDVPTPGGSRRFGMLLTKLLFFSLLSLPTSGETK